MLPERTNQGKLCRHVLALLAELEQAERERDEFIASGEIEMRKRLAAEARLAKVPALVEALREVVGASDRHYFERLQEIASEALAAFAEPGVPS